MEGMPSLPNLLRHHIDYTIWATHRLLIAAQNLTIKERTHDFVTADKSIAGTLTHLLRSERTWLGRIQQDTPKTPWSTPEDEDWHYLLEVWPQINMAWRDWAAHLTNEDAA